MSDMLDVLHYFFEEDALASSTAEHADAKDAVRENIYANMYETTYAYSSKKTKQTGFSELDYPLDEEAPTPIDPFAKSNAVKPFTPATDFDPNSSKPFGRVLDAPLG
jgi:hypothetical protein